MHIKLIIFEIQIFNKMESKNTELTKMLEIDHPLIMAPMFLVSNVKMSIAGMNSGVAACIPALNYRNTEQLKNAILELKAAKPKGGSFGFNLIVNKSNIKFQEQLDVLCELGVDFIITSLGSPDETIRKAKAKGIKVFCDVVNLEFAKKVESLGCDAVIAVNNKAGGHRGTISPEELIPLLVKNCSIPVISAGGVGNKQDLEKMLKLGAIGVSVGSPFIASLEADISDEYKNACVTYGQKDIVMTEKISGTPCTVINTDYVQKIGTKQTRIETLLNKNKKLKKWVKMLRFMIGTSAVTNAATKATYKTVWVAGPSIEHTKKIESVKEIINRFI